MEFKAYIDKCDNDYRAWAGTEKVVVSSWEEAEAWCEAHSWSGCSYILDYLTHKDARASLRTQECYNKFVKELQNE